ncbi:hypothetical protein MMYC01_200285 [Madurella mycetomatis]|uniref:Aminotransferase class I/classII large domain-containing protein n=1 Tax=Madurella mycetomatis TaxID=100816 RepID=A0A175WI19_9PEZI|nr:hypothetical protein MMYC01_200285 [Madurella mycetomatis]
MTELSSRMQKPASAILPKIAATIADRTNAARKIDLATAENWLIRPEIAEIYKDALQKNLTLADLSYPDGFGGDPKLQEALAGFFNKYFSPLSPVQPGHVVVTPGASNCLDSLLFSICEAGDSVLVLAPFWNGFDVHFMLRPNIKVVPVFTTSVSFLDRPTRLLSESLVPALEAALKSCEDESRVKAFVITNPHNPFARCYPEVVLREAMQWCAKRGLHYISDEVYALSDFSATPSPVRENGISQGSAPATPNGTGTNHSTEPDPTPFTSALSIALPADKTPPISVVWSTSKDLGSSGLRMGAHVWRPRHQPSDRVASSLSSSTTTTLLSTSLALLSTTQLPTISMLLTRCLLTSPRFDALVVTNRARLREHHDTVTRRLRAWGIPFVPATSGPYLLARLGVGAGDGVEDVVDVLRREAMVLVSPGKGFHFPGPGDVQGWVRITFAVPGDVLQEGLDRIGRALGV